jgi:hypothetical protein
LTPEHVTLGFRFLVALLLVTAAIPKLRNAEDFRDAVENYRLLPRRLAPGFAWWLPRIELVLGGALLIGLVPSPMAAAACLAFVAFSAAIAVNLARGREIDCGCLSSSTPRRITWRLVVVDLLLAAAAAAVVMWPTGTWTILDVGITPSAAVTHGDALAVLATAICAVLLARLANEGLRLRQATRRLGALGGAA